MSLLFFLILKNNRRYVDIYVGLKKKEQKNKPRKIQKNNVKGFFSLLLTMISLQTMTIKEKKPINNCVIIFLSSVCFFFSFMFSSRSFHFLGLPDSCII